MMTFVYDLSILTCWEVSYKSYVWTLIDRVHFTVGVKKGRVTTPFGRHAVSDTETLPAQAGAEQQHAGLATKPSRMILDDPG